MIQVTKDRPLTRPALRPESYTALERHKYYLGLYQWTDPSFDPSPHPESQWERVGIFPLETPLVAPKE